MSTFDAVMERLKPIEGGYVNDQTDRGGETNHGVTVAVARAYGYTGDMRQLTLEQARSIYEHRYWRQPGFDRIDSISSEVAAWLLDTGINMGTGTAAKMLQRALNVLNDGAKHYPDLTVDGALGAMSRDALARYLAVRGAAGRVILVQLLRALQAAQYVEIAEDTPSQERFAYGWVKRALG